LFNVIKEEIYLNWGKKFGPAAQCLNAENRAIKVE
jgi:hypothetical protein